MNVQLRSPHSSDVLRRVEWVINEFQSLPPGWHPAGSYSLTTLIAIARNALAAPVRFSAETGCGMTTAIISQLSGAHAVFAYQHPSQEVPLAYERGIFETSKIDFILGPTQRTILPHTFGNPLDLAIIDGPHGYPFPELEYFAFYPHLAPNALLVVDDIHIPTVRNLFNILCEERMFTLVEVCEKTAFFRRTSEPTFDPQGDGWWLQGYNQRFAPPELRPHLPR